MYLQDSVKSLMNSRVISVLPETPVIAAIDILLSNNFNGIPVVDKQGVIAGIITKYDLILQRGNINDDSKVKDVMNKEPLLLKENMTVDDAISMFTEHHRVDPIPVIDINNKVVGVISRYDMVKLFREYGVSFGSKDGSKSVNVKETSPVMVLILISLGTLVGFLYYFGYFKDLGGLLF